MFLIYSAKILGERLQDNWSSGLSDTVERISLKCREVSNSLC